MEALSANCGIDANDPAGPIDEDCSWDRPDLKWLDRFVSQLMNRVVPGHSPADPAELADALSTVTTRNTQYVKATVLVLLIRVIDVRQFRHTG